MELSLRPVRIALLRHGESEANLDKTIYERLLDHAVPLTAHGHEQAAAVGKKLRELFENEPVRAYVSPYLRALQTVESLGLAAEDLAAASFLYQKATRLGVGTAADF